MSLQRRPSDVEAGCGCLVIVTSVVCVVAFILVAVAAMKFAIEYLVK